MPYTLIRIHAHTHALEIAVPKGFKIINTGDGLKHRVSFQRHWTWWFWKWCFGNVCTSMKWGWHYKFHGFSTIFSHYNVYIQACLRSQVLLWGDFHAGSSVWNRAVFVLRTGSVKAAVEVYHSTEPESTCRRRSEDQGGQDALELSHDSHESERISYSGLH